MASESKSKNEKLDLWREIMFALVDAYRTYPTFTDSSALYVIETAIKFYNDELTTWRGEIDLPDFKPHEGDAFRLLNSACEWWLHLEIEFEREHTQKEKLDDPSWKTKFIEARRSSIIIGLTFIKSEIEKKKKWSNRRAYFGHLRNHLTLD
ncbi:MAG: hypothetical protein J2P41_09600 [Blastocatellia bacterium]|nr:hypothetical protein [Blastocatellia bacterium]